ncbi:MAG: hypothetical protein JNJ60_21390 [Rhodocyclaceae bacterium]|nr:hypothetical protein [Rhodocyclaceae bacterium]
MALTLVPQQLEALAQERFLDRVVGVLERAYPDSSEDLHSSATRAALRDLYEKSQRYGFSSELDIARYLITAWLLGVDFDTRFPAMAQILAAPSMTASQKADAIERVTTTLLDLLAAGGAR